MIYDAEALKEMIPLYLNGQLSDEEQKAFAQGLKDSPELAAEVAEYEAIQASYPDLEAETPFPPKDILFGRIMDKIDREETSPVRDQAVAREVKSGWREKLADFFYTTCRSPKVAWSVAVVQVVLLVVLLAGMPQRGTFQTLTAPGRLPDGLITLNVVFDPDTREKDMRAVLIDNGATIVGGPSADGRYIVAIAGNRSRQAVADAMLQSGVVAFVGQHY
jgi:anti-sigma factor RsiW